MASSAEGKKIVVLEEKWGKVITMNSATQVGPDEAGQIVIAGSHGSDFVARLVSRYVPFGIILNDAGKGKENQGISGMPVLNAVNILGATVDCMTAHIGEGDDSYRSGIISAANDLAKAAGVRVGMKCAEAARLMLAARKNAQILYETPLVYDGPEGRIFLADSGSYLTETHRGSMVVCGSHCAHTTVETVKKFGPKGIFQNDAGKGKDNQGISGLPLYDRVGIPAAAIDCNTAKIGDARDAWEAGKLSTVNELAARLGVTVGMAVQEAAFKILKARSASK